MPLSRSLSPKERGAIRRCERKGGLFNTYKDVLFLNSLKLPPLGEASECTQLGMWRLFNLLFFNNHLLGKLVEGDFVGACLADFPLVIGVRAVGAENHRFFHTGGSFISFRS